jgi:lipoprotein-anchoring transpeptidase ErfK/SrfK
MFKILPLFIIAAFVLLLLSISPINPTNTPVASADVTFTDGGTMDPKALTDATGVYQSGQTLAYYNSHQVAYPKDLAEAKTTQVLGVVDSAGKEKWIEVDLAKQQLTAWNGNEIYMQYPISSGLFYPTPTGTFNIYSKFRYIRMKGGDPAAGDYYDLPNVPDTMFFYQGYGIHGAYWHNNFGHPMSHGCVNEPLAQAHSLFEWAGPQINPDQSSVRATADNPGSRVWIH